MVTLDRFLMHALPPKLALNLDLDIACFHALSNYLDPNWVGQHMGPTPLLVQGRNHSKDRPEGGLCVQVTWLFISALMQPTMT